MKKLLLLASLLLAASTATSSLAQDSANVSADPLIAFGSNPHARIGMTRTALIDQLGEPTEKLSPRLWVYGDFRPAGYPVGDRYDTLIVVLVDDRVSLLRLVDKRQVELALAKLRLNAAKSAAIARK